MSLGCQAEPGRYEHLVHAWSAPAT
jgi:hypothetical protein